MSFGIDLAMLREARAQALELNRGTVGDNVMYFETGQGSALSAEAHHGVDQQTCEARAYAVARHLKPLLVNTVVGFIGPEYLYDGKQILRAALEDHFCGKLLGLPMGCDVCYTNHAEADADDMDATLTHAGRGRGELHHGRAGRRRHHAELSEHVVPRCALSAPDPESEARAGVRNLDAEAESGTTRCDGALTILEHEPAAPARFHFCARRPARAREQSAYRLNCLRCSSLMRGRGKRCSRNWMFHLLAPGRLRSTLWLQSRVRLTVRLICAGPTLDAD